MALCCSIYLVLLIDGLYLFEFQGIPSEGSEHAPLQGSSDGVTTRDGTEQRNEVQCFAGGHGLGEQCL